MVNPFYSKRIELSEVCGHTRMPLCVFAIDLLLFSLYFVVVNHFTVNRTLYSLFLTPFFFAFRSFASLRSDYLYVISIFSDSICCVFRARDIEIDNKLSSLLILLIREHIESKCVAPNIYTLLYINTYAPWTLIISAAFFSFFVFFYLIVVYRFYGRFRSVLEINSN